MQQLRGNYADLDKTKMLPAEIAVCNDHNPFIRTENGFKELLTKDDEDFYEKKVEELNKAMENANDLAVKLPQIAETVEQNAESAKESASQAKESEANALESETNALKSEESAKESADSALASQKSAKESETSADKYSKMSKSYAVGDTGTREDENTDNAKYYAEYAKDVKNQIDKKLSFAEFDVNENGELVYTDNSSILWSVDDNGNLNWEVE